ncbi:unnamed protein product [Paramecium pentaurelia]|uniref:Uncharacterized protein n=1 Tax=Paramecium pentaurelia TaxID=43138 RepID=A0A8S1X6G3_9CILI|nr:unnamed protein product [Paramecium pentaurelia]
MTLLFHLIYFTSFVDQFVETLYMSNLIFFGFQNSSFFYVILTALKFVFSALIGFIIDHVQYTYNLLFGSQLLVLFSYAFYLVFIVQLCSEQFIVDYLYFANAFLILGQQLGSIIIITLISKHYQRDQIPYQISYFQKYGFSGKLFCSVIVLILYIFFICQDKLTTETLLLKNKYIIIILSIIPFIILLVISIFLHQTFVFFKLEAEELMPEIKLIPVQQKGNLLNAIKNIFKTDSAWIALSAGIIMGIIKIWLVYQETQVIQQTQNPFEIFGIYMFFELPTIISLSLVSTIVKNFEIETISLQALIDKAIDSFVFFLLSILLSTSITNNQIGEIIIFGIIRIFQQYYLTVISISGASIIGMQKENYKNQGLTFGLLGMIENGFAVWVVLAMWFGSNAKIDITKNGIGSDPKNGIIYGIIYGFAFGYSLISIISSKMLQFDKQVNKLGHKVYSIEQKIDNVESQEQES